MQTHRDRVRYLPGPGCKHCAAAGLIALLVAAVLTDLSAQTLNLHLGVDRDVVQREDRVAYTATVSNTGSGQIEGLVVDLTRPGNTANQARLGHNTGTLGSTARWTVGSLPPGESRNLVQYITVNNNAPDGPLTATLSATADGFSEVQTEVNITVVPTPSLRLNLAPDPGPIPPGEPFTYTLSFGNIGSGAVPDVVLRMPVPAGADFVDASDGGTEEDGLVTWTLGTVDAGAGGSVRLTVTPDAGLGNGHLITSSAEILPNGNPAGAVRARTATPVRSSARLHVHYSVSQSEGFDAGDPTTFVATITNTGNADQANVTVHLQTPEYVSSTSILGTGVGTMGTRRQWNVGTLAPGESRQVGLTVSASNAVDGDVVRSIVLAHSDDSHAMAAQAVLISRSPQLRVSVLPDAGPAVPGEPFVYTLTFGNMGPSAISDVVLRMPVPAGAAFASATDGGFAGDGVVTWNLGTVEAGASGSVLLTVLPEPGTSNQHLLEALATLDPGAATGAVVRSSAATPIANDAPLRLQYTMSQSTTGHAGGRMTYLVTVSNAGSTVQNDVEVRILRPRYQSFGFLGSVSTMGQTHRWDVGPLAPGESRQLGIIATTTDAPQGDLLRSTILATSNAGEALAALTLSTDNDPDLRLSIAPDAGPAVPDEPVAYTITFSNIGTADADNVLIEAPIPEGTDFTRASDGGVVSGGIVTWAIDRVAAGDGGSVRLAVTPGAGSPAGRTLVARAALDRGTATGGVIRSSAATPVSADTPLRVAYTVSQSSGVEAGLGTILTASVSNAGDTQLSDVVIYVERPPQIDLGFMWVGISTTGNSSTWTIGTLAPGESRHLAILADLRNAPKGELVRGHIIARSSGGGSYAGRTVLVDHQPQLHLNMAHGASPAVPGEPVTYNLTFANSGSNPSGDLTLRVPLPGGTSFVDATCGATLTDGYVWWDVSGLGAGSGSQFFVTVTPDAGLQDGHLLGAVAELDAGGDTGTAVRSWTSTALRDAGHLRLSFSQELISVTPGGDAVYSLVAMNSAASALNDVAVRFHQPPVASSMSTVGGSVGSVGNVRTWNIGTLGAGQSDTLTVTVRTAAEASPGWIIRGPAVAAGTGAQTVSATAHADVVLGSRMNFAPMPAEIFFPEDEATYNIGGLEEEDPVPPDSVFVVTWSEPCDPEDDALTFTWQLATGPDFTTVLIDAPGAEGGTAPRYETTFGTLAALLTAQGVAFGESITLYHRVLTHDGTNETEGEALRVVFTRGTIVSIEDDAALPAVFALHANYPNPFNPSTTFAFDLPEPADVRLIVYDVVGREIATVVAEPLTAGRYEYVWNAGHLPSGVYVYRLEAGDYSEMRRMVLVK